MFPEDNCQCLIAMRRNKEQFVIPWKKKSKTLQFVEKKVKESEVKTPENVRKQHSQDYSTGIRILIVPEIASQNSEQRLQHDMKHVMAILEHTIGEKPTSPDCFRIVNMTKRSEEASS